MQTDYLDYEQRLQNLDQTLKGQPDCPKLLAKRHELLSTLYTNLSDWQIVQLSRHTDRWHAKAIITQLCSHYEPLSGDRMGARCLAMQTGFARIADQRFLVISQQKGKDIEERQRHNFGMATPAGYRQAHRAMRLAERLGIPILSLIDTPGAYPGIDAEQQNQSGAIAENMLLMSQLTVPIIVVITGEGMSGGALGVGVGDRLAMLEHAILSVISPEGCASILWQNKQAVRQAADIMALSAKKLLEFGLIDRIIAEGRYHAMHHDPVGTCDNIKAYVLKTHAELSELPAHERLELRKERLAKDGCLQLS